MPRLILKKAVASRRSLVRARGKIMSPAMTTTLRGRRTDVVARRKRKRVFGA